MKLIILHKKYLLVILLYLFIHSKTLALTSFTKYENNPILTPITNTWESERNAYPSVIYDENDNTFKMWYAGRDNLNWSIGYATSVDGKTWNKYNNNPVLAWNSADNTEPKNFLTPYVIKEKNVYRMWYTSTPDDISNFKIGYAISNDGINWQKMTSSLIVPEPEKGEGAIVSPNVIKINETDYRMWYVLNGGQGWRLGYATSSDGLAWTKYPGNPVISRTTNWEGTQIGKSTVIYKNNLFHLWYDTNSPGSSIVYAFSSDGISWTKPAEYNPVLLPNELGGFNSFNIGAPNIVNRLNEYYLFFTGLTNENNNTYWKIGLATNNPPTPTLTPTSTPVPTPTDTPIPTPTVFPTATPTPSSVVTNKVLLIPGLGGSWNLRAMAMCDANTQDNEWTLAPYAQHVYEPLMKSLKKNGYDVSLFNYDWRKDVRSHTNALSSTVNTLVQNGEKMSLIGHSLGGLVGTSYVMNPTSHQQIANFLTVGTPHQGTPIAYSVWAAGDSQSSTLEWRIATSLIITACRVAHDINATEAVQQYIPSVQNILPTFDYLRNRTTNSLKPISSLFHKNNYLPSGLSMPYQNIRLGTVSGKGHKTLSELVVKDPSLKELASGMWLDGKITKEQYSSDGDGTILNTSSELTGGENILIDGDHTSIINKQEGIRSILNFLHDSSSVNRLMETQQEEMPEYGTILVSYPSTLVVQNKNNRQVKESQGIVLFNNHPKSVENITILPKNSDTVLFVGQFTKNGEVNWKVFKYKYRFPFAKRIYLDRNNILNNPIE